MLRSLTVIRHGATPLNNDDVSVDRIRGWRDIPLSPEGREEAERLGSDIEGESFDAIVSSDLARAADTASIVGSYVGAPPIVLTRTMRPWNVGNLAGEKTSIAVPILARYIDDYPDRNVDGGESFNSFKARFFSGIARMLASHEGRIAIVTHHRNERLLAAWQKAGFPTDGSIDLDEFKQRGEPTAALIEFDIPTDRLPAAAIEAPHYHDCHMHDAARKGDPTGTGDLRKRFMRASDKRWQQASRLVREAVVDGDILGLDSPNMSSIALRAKHGGIAGADKTSGFHAWLQSILNDVVIGHDGSWMVPFVAEAERRAKERAVKIGAKNSGADHDMHPHRALMLSELHGIASFAVQQGTRAAARAVTAKPRPSVVARDIDQTMKEAMKRARLMTDYLISKAFTGATVAHFRASGITSINLDPEGARPRRYGTKKGGLVRERVRDAEGVLSMSELEALLSQISARGPEAPITRPTVSPFRPRRPEAAEPSAPSPATAPARPQARTFGRRRARVRPELMQLLTAGDDRVCEQCEDASNDGPYTLEEIVALIPLHGRCRCAAIPAFDARFSHAELV